MPRYWAPLPNGSQTYHLSPLRSASHSVGICSLGANTGSRFMHADDRAISLAWSGVRTASVAQPDTSKVRMRSPRRTMCDHLPYKSLPIPALIRFDLRL